MPNIHLENKLRDSKSIYLKRHSENPVPWQTWSDDTFKLAKKLNRPIFLSSGYASCHWCRVMEQESFSDPEIAKILSESFIPIKLDKDEFPDVDKEFQFYLQSTGEPGGWPLSVFLTPDKDPFFAGTYYPPKQTPNTPSFKMVLDNIKKIYNNTPEEIDKVTKVRNDFLESFLEIKEPPVLTKQERSSYYNGEFKKIFDMEFGGFRQSAKFPNIPSLMYLTEQINDEKIIKFLLTTADKFCISALQDNLFGGFFRYTTDRKWMYPHFEKMLTDNAQIPIFLLKMYELTEKRIYLLTAKKALDYIIHNFMTDYGIVNSLDADSLNSKGLLSEGFFYKVNDRDFTVLSEGELKNFPNDAGVENGIIYFKSPEYIKIAAMQPTLEKIARRVISVKTPPAFDNKIVSGHNFMFCTSLLYCFEISGEDWYLNQATALFQKIRHLAVDDSKVYRGTYLGEIINHRVLDDHVFYLEATIKFFELTKEKEFLVIAQNLVDEIEKSFVKEGIPYLDTNKEIIDSFDDDKPNPLGLYYYLRTVYNYLFVNDINPKFVDFAQDRALRFPTGHPSILRAK